VEDAALAQRDVGGMQLLLVEFCALFPEARMIPLAASSTAMIADKSSL
jgi:hypothetical protein